jgi:nucleoside triphosphate pyrophosphatase
LTASKIVLASASASRQTLLTAAGIAFVAKPADIDERSIEAPLLAAGRGPDAIAMALAEAKALAVGAGDALVIGADQVLSLDGRQWHKPADLSEARRQLAALGGRTHRLHTAVAAVRGQAVTWRHAETAAMTMRPMSAAVIDAYLAEVGERALSSVGAYQIEGPGIRLFDAIDGDYFSILGLPLLPLLRFLRENGTIR